MFVVGKQAVNYVVSTMNVKELDSFYFKFKNLLFVEKDANLVIKSEGGCAHVSLSVDLRHVLTDLPQNPHHLGHEPSLQRLRAQ